MHSFTVIQKRAYLKGVAGDEKNLKKLDKLEDTSSEDPQGSVTERFNSWDEQQLDAAINAHIRSTVARLTDTSCLEEGSKS